VRLALSSLLRRARSRRFRQKPRRPAVNDVLIERAIADSADFIGPHLEGALLIRRGDQIRDLAISRIRPSGLVMEFGVSGGAGVNQFASVLKQDLNVEKLLPISPEDLESEESDSVAGPDYIYEPSAEAILAELLPRFVSLQIYRVLLDSQAAEHAARMTAMDNATKNARDLIDKLTLVYNQSRQAAITTELIEVVSGAAALEG